MRKSLIFLLAALSLPAAVTYQKAPPEIRKILDAPSTPVLSVSPAKTYVILAEPLRYPPIAEVSQPMLRLAGIRINPRTNGLHTVIGYASLVLKKIDGTGDTTLALPTGSKAGMPRWNKYGSAFAFTVTLPDRIELWTGVTATGRVRRAEGVRLNAVLGTPLTWMDDGRTLLLQLVPPSRGAAPEEAAVPAGPIVQESSGRSGPIRTYEDMLSSPHDEDLFDYYATSQLAWLDTQSGRLTNIGAPSVFQSATASPDGKHLATARLKRPYSYLHPYIDFPKDIEIVDLAGKRERLVASQPLLDRVPIDGVPVGPRAYQWRPSSGASLLWVEALDGGNPKEKAINRDRVVALDAPFQGEPREVIKLEQRYQNMMLADKGGLALVNDFERNKRWARTFRTDLDNPAQTPELIWSRNVQDRYKNPGLPVMAEGRRGGMLVDGDNIYLRGEGASPKGDRPFLDRFNVKTKQSERLFQSDENSFETVEAMLDDHGARFITRRESPTEPPNYYVKGTGGATVALTKIADPSPELRKVEKRLVTYKRADGTPLSFTLYLPPNYKTGTRLPTVVWAYPLEFNDADTAGQISGSTKRFTTITGMSHLFFLLRGYAILDNAAMPVIGDPETVNNTYLEQIVADAKAAIDKAVEIGVTDPNRVGVGGHSYGAFMTANLLSHCDLFKAGIARSGAYNRTLTPFGFQTERRTIWEAPETYLQMSPFLNAHKIKRPILLIHGEADDNTGTFPIQSERMYQAIRGNGGTVRLVMLPAEAHGYRARESLEHTLWEMITWFDKYVKGDETRATSN